MSPSNSSEKCRCGPDWRKHKLNGTCETCGGWLPDEALAFSLTRMWVGEEMFDVGAPLKSRRGGRVPRDRQLGRDVIDGRYR